MKKQPTVLTELIERLEKLINNFPNDAGLKTSREIAIELMDQEKSQIVDAFIKGTKSKDSKVVSEAQDYYKNKYKELTDFKVL